MGAGHLRKHEARYLHVPDAMLKDVARKIGDAILEGPHRKRWGPSRFEGSPPTRFPHVRLGVRRGPYLA
ncbi:hypothetical protein Sgleb_37750 [Streptomyces glebosus]|uniref:Uncharacterized protein n=1 Tax=Streptomyces glebosus TaxID=249580 RepID=A0A640SXF7_9ACTN|nr:hypothetical protein Sgleb_37750 [Streptomyces glebosus]